MRSGRERQLWAGVCGALVATVAITGCGNNYRPVVTPITSSGPGAQVNAYSVVVSAPSATTAGVATIIDYSGDTIMAQVPIGPGPTAFTIDEYGSTGYTYNTDHTLSNFPISTSLQPKNVSSSTLPVSAQPLNINAPANGLWIGNLASNTVDTFTGTPAGLKLSIPMAPATIPVFVAGAPAGSGQRQYAISQNIPGSTGVECNLSPQTQPAGTVTPVEMASSTTDLPIPVGKCPVFAVQSPDQRRLFVLNRGDDTITVINSQTNTLDACTPFQNQNGQWVTCHATIQLPAGSGPVYAEYNIATSQLVVANYVGGTISVIDVSTDQYGNDANSYANSTCIASGSNVSTYAGCGAVTGGFGTIHTITVGPNPASVTVLYDGSRAYTANQGAYTAGCSVSSCNGSVTIVNLSSYTVEKTLPVVGVPRSVVSTQNSLYGKVYVASPNSPYLTILATQYDLVSTTVLVPGEIVDVRATLQSGAQQSIATYYGSISLNNPNFSSRVPGYGQPCNLPPGLMSPPYTLAQCAKMP